VSNEHAGIATEASDAADDRKILCKSPVAGQRLEVRNEPADIVSEMRALGVARDLDLLPRVQLLVELAMDAVLLGRELRDFLDNIELVDVREVAKFLDLALKLGDWLLEFEKCFHSSPIGCQCAPVPGHIAHLS
jgi:hypothetical protein